MSRERRPASASRAGRSKSMCSDGGLSYEDMLVAKYLDELRKVSPYNKTAVTTDTLSPYQQRLANTHVVPVNRRPQSAASGRSAPSQRRQRVADDYDNDSFYSDVRPPRPTSAPVHKRPLSAYSNTRSATGRTVSYTRKVRSLYRQQTHALVVIAFKNGSQTECARVAAPNVPMLLEACTDKLGLPKAARRLFLSNGREVFSSKDLYRDAEVYVSTGESFKDPVKDLQNTFSIAQKSQWTMNGLVWPQNARKKPTVPRMSKRFRELTQTSHRRVLVFKNGSGTQSIELVADPDPKKLNEFLTVCTSKLELGSCGRVLFDWEGKEVTDLADAPVLDDCLQNSSTPVLGPLWLSKGECFSPKGVREFLTGLITYTKCKMKEAKRYQKQLQYGQNEDTKDQVEIVAILSMTEKEIEEALDIVGNDIENYRNACNKLQEQIDKINAAAEEELRLGSQYTMQHIRALDADDKMTGKKGIRLKVYENGSSDGWSEVYFNVQLAMRGVTKDNQNEILMQRLLDQCGSCASLAYPKKNPAIRPVPKKLFRKNGQEIKSVHELNYDDEVWLSFGESWRNPSTYVVTVQVDKAKAYKIGQTGDDSSEAPKRVLREQLMTDDTKNFDSLRSNTWQTVQGFPDDIQPVVVSDPSVKESVLSQLASGEVDANQSSFIRLKDSSNVVLYCEAVVSDKLAKNREVPSGGNSAGGSGGGKDGPWPADTQLWTISKEKFRGRESDKQELVLCVCWNALTGYISSKMAPQLVLTVLDQKIAAELIHPLHGPSKTRVEGCLVGLQKKQSHVRGQQWTFTPEGNIRSQDYQDLLLTYLGAIYSDEDCQVVNEEPGMLPGQKCYIAACQRIDGKQAKAQRWAIKQERFDNIGQWKYTQVENPEWNKQALSWPIVMSTGEFNEEYDWPMEGFLLPYAPPTKQDTNNTTPLRLRVLRNGAGDPLEAINVVPPALKRSVGCRDAPSSMTTAGSKKKGGHRHQHHGHAHRHHQHHPEPHIETDDQTAVKLDCKIHCTDMTVYQQQFFAFLDTCTTLLDLPFAARRVFDEAGNEYFNLSTLNRDQLVYVTCGEPWSDPKLSKSEQQRHFLLSNLAADVAQIRQFVQLSKAQNLVLEVDRESGLRAGAPLIINSLATSGEENDTGLNETNGDNILSSMSAHEMSHRNVDQKANKSLWPWERLVNSGIDDVEQNSDDVTDFRSSRKSFGDGVTNVNNNSSLLQRFVYEDDTGLIACDVNRNLVLSVREQSTEPAFAVCLAKRSVDDVYQRWIVSENGVIQAKCNPQMVLTVSMKQRRQSTSALPDGTTPLMSYVGCPCSLQRLKTTQFGRANQRWMLDRNTGLIYAFYTHANDKEITAANMANVCTYAVMGATEIDQTGYEVEMPGDKNEEPKRIWTCSSCARAIRGRYRMKKLEGNVDFFCAMGNAKQLGIQQIGSFRCLNGKVDLSTYEAEHTLNLWESKLQKLRQESGVRTIAKNISAAQCPYTVKVLAYRNSEGRTKDPELVIGSSVSGILNQCSKRLKMNQAARRLYTADGIMILSIDDLIEWAKDSYVKAERERLQRELNDESTTEQKQAGDGSNANQQENGTTQDESQDEVVIPVGTEFIVGNDSSCDRANLDSEPNCIIVPDLPAIHADGLLVSWTIFARQPGTVALDVFRRNDKELSVFTLVGQTVFEVSDGGLGELLIDISSQPLSVQRGDVIGFHVIDFAVIPYDEDESRMSTMYYQSLDNIEAHGATVKLDSDLFPFRTYSLSANIVVNVDKSRKENSKKAATAALSNGKSSQETKQVARVKVEPPSVDAMLRYPIEVFVSCGEAFVKPEKAVEDNESRRQRRSQVAAVSYELYKEKHILRLMKGRRIEDHSPVRFSSTSDPEQPILVDGGWQQPSAGEIEKHSLVRHLQMELHKIRSAQKPKTIRACNQYTTQRLYTQPDTKRLLVYVNGEKVESAQYVWGDSVAQILYNSVIRLHLNKQPKYLFSLDGQQIDNLSAVERDQILCVSSHKKFLRPQESQRFVEIKANWVRACRRRGHRATDVDKILYSNGSHYLSGLDSKGSSPERRHVHTHSIVLEDDKFLDCPTCKQRCVTESDVISDSVVLSARQMNMSSRE